MIKAAIITLGLFALLANAGISYAQEQPDAVKEVIRRTHEQMVLRDTLAKAQAAESRRNLTNSATLYDDAWVHVQSVGTGVEEEREQTRAGLARVRLELAQRAQSAGNLREADKQIVDLLRVDPSNPVALDFKDANDKLLRAQIGKIPSEEAMSKLPQIAEEKVKTQTLVQDGRLYYEAGKYEDAVLKLKQALKEDPHNQAAYYYLNLINEKRNVEALNRRDVASRASLVELEQAWANSPKRDLLPIPNPYARSTSINTSRGRQIIMSKLDRIRLDKGWDGLPLSEVIKDLGDESRKRDPERKGINFIINPNTEAAAAPAASAIDPATGLPIPAAAPAEPVDVGATLIKINPTLTDVRLADVLDAIIKVADHPIKYSIEDYAVVFSVKSRDATPLFVRVFKVDPNTFYQGLEGVIAFPFGSSQSGTSGGGGGSTGGGGSSGGGQSGQGGELTVPRVQLAAGGISGGGGGGGGLSSGGGSGQGGGIANVTRTNRQETAMVLVRDFFTTLGVSLIEPGKSVFFNEREGSLLVRASAQDLDIIEQAMQILNIAPPQVNIKAKFIEISQNDTRALGFDWYLGNVLMNHGRMGLIGGTAPSYNGQSTAANPEGTFPGSVVNGTALPASGTDALITQGLRGVTAPAGGVSSTIPAVATFSSILTDPQFRVVVRALEQRDGTDLLNEASVTTLSGRQTEIQVVDQRTIVIAPNLNQTGTGGGGGLTGTTGGGAVATTLNYSTAALPFGPTLDVIPYVSADGFTIQMTIIPTITEFLGYDDPGGFVPQAQSVSGGAGGVGIPITGQLPLPHYRLRQVTTSCIVWDGQTVVLGGLITEDVTKLRDKVPILGDLPLLGRFFRSEASSTKKKNLVIFVTPTIIDPSGNPYHSQDEMPFAQVSIPAQPVTAPPPAP